MLLAPRCYWLQQVTIDCTAGDPPFPWTCYRYELLECNSQNCVDNDGDGYSPLTATCNPPPGEVDCNDTPAGANINPGATEICNDADGVDENCDGFANCQDSFCRQGNPVCETQCDRDGDGYISQTCEGGNDCVDDPTGPFGSVALYIHPGVDVDGDPMTETSGGPCTDQVDWDCDGLHNCADPDCSQDEACIVPTPTPPGGGGPVIGQQFCYDFYMVYEWYLSYDGGITWEYWYTEYEYVGSGCYISQ